MKFIFFAQKLAYIIYNVYLCTKIIYNILYEHKKGN